jgi:hypothetical protein
VEDLGSVQVEVSPVAVRNGGASVEVTYGEENGEPKKLPAECEEGLLYTQPSPSSPGKSKALKTI